MILNKIRGKYTFDEEIRASEDNISNKDLTF